jgi:hypothetical protein
MVENAMVRAFKFTNVAQMVLDDLLDNVAVTAEVDLLKYLFSDALDDAQKNNPKPTINPRNAAWRIVNEVFQIISEFNGGNIDPDLDVRLYCDYSRFGNDNEDCNGAELPGFVCDRDFQRLVNMALRSDGSMSGFEECRNSGVGFPLHTRG